MPIGLWMITGKSADRGTIVIACLTGPGAIEGDARGYIGSGSCPDHTEPLIKPIAAIAGDLVTVTRGGITVNGVALPHTAPLSHDSAGRLLHALPEGTYKVAPGEVWLCSGHDPRSYDSRYFGPVPVATILATVKPLVVF
jgi:conjugative transfer signal peptidase TraF